MHSHNGHLYGLPLEMAKKNGVRNVFVHCLMDGRDKVRLPPACNFLAELQEKMKANRPWVGSPTVMGRYYAMDRDNRWERVERLTPPWCTARVCRTRIRSQHGEAPLMDAEGKISPTNSSCPLQGRRTACEGGDTVIFFNFRPDRAREITRTLWIRISAVLSAGTAFP